MATQGAHGVVYSSLLLLFPMDLHLIFQCSPPPPPTPPPRSWRPSPAASHTVFSGQKKSRWKKKRERERKEKETNVNKLLSESAMIRFVSIDARAEYNLLFLPYHFLPPLLSVCLSVCQSWAMIHVVSWLTHSHTHTHTHTRTHTKWVSFAPVDPGRFWMILEGSGRFWMILGGLF